MLYFIQKKYIYIFIIIILLQKISCQLKINLKYFPIYKYDNSTPLTIFKGIIYTKLYANLELGTPKQLIQIPLDFYSNDFYISDYPKYQFEQEPDKFSNMKLYDKSLSNSKKDIEKKYLQGDNFYYADYMEDIFYFENISTSFEFYLPHILKEVESGGLGLQLMPLSNSSTSTPNPQRTFLRKLKNKNIIKDYYWSIFYNKKENNKQDEGFILLGCLPNELNQDFGYLRKELFNEKNIKTINALIQGDTVLNKFNIDKIYAFKGNDEINYLIFDNSSESSIEIDYNFGGIEAPYKIKAYLENIFSQYISNENCFIGLLNMTTYSNKSFFYCKNNKDTKAGIKNGFSDFKFKNNGFNFAFDITYQDLFVEANEFLFCLLIFNSNFENKWVMGKPYTKKYQFSFNPDKRTIIFYSLNNKEEVNKHNNNDKIFIILGIIIFILLVIIGILLWKFYLKDKYLRKKRANELDDDYEYIQKKEEKKENEGKEKLIDEQNE